MVLTLYLDLMSQPSRAVLLFCLENKIEHKVVQIQIAKGQQKTADFAAKNPNRKLPAIDDDGFALFESHTILRYLATTRKVADHWYPADPKARANVEKWMDWHLTNLRPGAAGSVFAGFLGPKMGLPADALAKQAAETGKQLGAALRMMNDTMLSGANTYLTGSAITIYDLLAANELSMTALIGFDLAPYPKVSAWYQRVAALQHWKAVHVVLDKVVASNKPKAKL